MHKRTSISISGGFGRILLTLKIMLPQIKYPLNKAINIPLIFIN